MHFPKRNIDTLAAFVLRYVLRYRLKVVSSNLIGSFTYASEKELNRDILDFYAYLSRVFRQVLLNYRRRELERKIKMPESPELSRWLESGKSVIVTFGHTGNWEWTGAYLGMRFPDQVGAIYKKIKSGWLNKLTYTRRHTFVNYLFELREMGDLLKFMKRKPILLLMICDQNPGSPKGNIWVPFLRRETAFVNGPENLALKFNLPVVYIHSASGPDDGYTLSCHTLFDGSENVTPGEIMNRFGEHLEKNIQENRSNWLWSHRRWKRVKPVSIQA